MKKLGSYSAWKRLLCPHLPVFALVAGVATATATPPLISNLANRSMAANSTSPSIPFTIGDAETPAASLVVWAASTNTALVPTNRITLSGSASNRFLRITPVSDSIGTSLITITVRDAAWETASSSFQLTVTNSPPTISDIATRMINPGITSSVIPFVVYDKETSPSNLVVSVTSSNPGLIPESQFFFGGYGSNRNFRVLPEMQLGSSTVTFTVTDSIGAKVSDTFDLVVTNAKPTIPYVPDIFGVMNRTSPPSTFVIGDLETAANNLLISGFSSNQALVADAGISFGGSGSNRWVSVMPNSNQVGSTQLKVVVTDQFNGRATNQMDVTISQFAALTNELPGYQYCWLAWADYDRDGVLDYAIMGSPATNLIYRGKGDGTFTNIGANLLGMEGGALEWADYDGDGDPDLLTSGRTAAGTGATRLYRNDNGVFNAVATGLPDLSYSRIAWGDYDNDGDPDLLFSGESNQVAITKLFRNENGTFADSGVPFPQIPTPVLAWGDYDNDGDLDLFFSSSSAAYVYRNAGKTNFSHIVARFPGLGGGTAQWGDYDGDGDLDLLLHGGDSSGAGSTRLFRNDNGVFTQPSVGLDYLARTGAQWGDYDNDGDLDVALGYRYEQSATIFYRNDGGQYLDSSNRVASVGSGALAWGDSDNDGLLDLLQTGSRDYPSYAKLTRLFRNYGPATNTPPSTPAGLAAEVSGRTVRLTWNAATDVNQSAPLTYNLRVGSAPGGASVISPLSLADGKRLVPGFGNAWLNRSWVSQDLAPGTYYASVQAVDAGFAGSGFSTEISFTIANAPSAPSAQTEAPTAITFREATFQAIVSANGLSTMAWFEYGTTPVLELKTPATSIGSGAGYLPLAITVTNLLADTTYYVRSAVANSARTNYGQPRVFSTLPFSDFSEMPALLPGSDASGAHWVDYDIDGDLDLVGSKIVRNTAGVFATVGSTSLEPGTWNDFNNDNVPDALWSRGVQINNKNNSFSNTTLTLALTVPEYAVGNSAWGDFDNDGDLDLLISGRTIFYEYSATGLYRNEGNWQFTTVTNNMPAALGGAPGWLDYDNDGWLDAFLSGHRWLTQPMYLYRNTAGLAFSDSGAVLTESEGTCRDWADFDNDGDLDLAVGPQTRIYRNDGAGTFTLVSTNLPACSQISWGDFDNDGRADLLLISPEPTFWKTAMVCRNEGGGAFSTNSFRADGATSAYWGDYDRDGDLDIFVYGTRYSENFARIYRNNSAISNSAPTVPTDLRSAFEGKAVKLSWNASSDANQGAGWSYNLRIGRTPGGTEVLSPMSDVTNGVHYVARMGNAGLGNGWVMTNLPVGTYYWSVQAIDHGLVASKFATEQTLVIPAWPPDIVSVGFTNPTLSTVTLKGTVNPNGLATLVWFEYGTSAAYTHTSASRWLPGTTLAISTNLQISGLLPLAEYHFRMGASNSLGVSFSPDQTFSTIQFTRVDNPFNLSQSWYGAWADLNTDGLLDAFINGYNGATYAGFVELNNGDGTFRQGSSIGFGYTVAGILNLDKDEDLDLLLPGNYRPIFFNDGQGQLMESTNSFGFSIGLLVPGDMDNDGDVDFLAAGTDANSRAVTLIVTNHGSGVFSDSSQGALIQTSGGVASWGDTDDDGDLDLVFSGNAGVNSTNFTRLYRNDGAAGFTALPGLFPYISGGSVTWVDYNNDNHLDAFITGWGTNGYTARLYRKDGPNLYTEVDPGIVGTSLGSAQWGDFNNDGLADVLLTGYTNGSMTASLLYRNLGSDQFGLVKTDLPGVLNGVAAWGDYELDGDLDILLAGQYVPGNLYRNNTLTPNAIPQAPAALSSIVINGNSALLTWSRSTDANQNGGHTFNLRVGTAPGKGDVMSANAVWPTGTRRIPAPGNVLTYTNRLVKNLTPGTYYWSVQSVDHSYAGSPFAQEQTFTVLPFTQPPSLSMIPATNVQFFTAQLRSAVNPNEAPSWAWFEYGPGTNYGFSTAPITVGAGPDWVEVNQMVSNLVTETTYHWRCAASNANGVSYGLDQTFTTLPHVLFTEGAQLLAFSDGSADWGDYDNDGDLDLLVTGLAYESGSYTRCRIYQNNAGTFTNAVNIPAGSWQGDAKWGDYDNDGDLDIVVCGNSDQVGNMARIYRNDGSNVFTYVPVTLPAVYEGRTAWGDIDRDGDLDLVVASSTSSGVYRNDGHDVFVLQMSLLTVSSPAVSLADYDNDGDLDILLLGYASGSISRIYINNGRGDFTYINTTLPRLTTGAADWADIDGDGDLDLALVGNQGGSPVTYYAGVFRNDGNGVFTDLQDGMPGVSYASCAFGDYDNDGDPDLLITGMLLGGGRTSKVYRNDGAAGFVDSGAALQPNSDGRAVWGDYDNDGDLDFVQVGNGYTRVYRNNAIMPNAAPTAPGSLSAITWQNTALLSWSAPNDANQTGGFTYNVRIGSTPGASDVLGPMATTANGWRRIAQTGNAGTLLSLMITNLPSGTFYWSVQTIDHSYAGSAFAPEAMFSLQSRPPDAFTGKATNVTETTALLTGYASPNGAGSGAWFQYGVTAYTNTTPAQFTGNGFGEAAVTAAITNLMPGFTYHFRLAASNSFGTSYGADQTFVPPMFTEIAAPFAQVAPGSVMWGDYDRDGDLDLVLTGDTTNFVNSTVSRVYRNEGNSTFTALPGITPPAVYPGNWGDYDNDGDLDLLLLTRLYDFGDGSFRLTNTAMPTLSYPATAWGDYDNDGKLDILLAGHAGGSGTTSRVTQVYRNLGSGAFASSGATMQGVENPSVTWGDYDNDGDLDVLRTGFNTGGVRDSRIYRSNGNGTFSSIGAFLLTGVTHGSAVWGDYDNDGDLDVLLTGQSSDGAVSKVYRNEGADVFLEAAIGLPTVLHGTALWADYDNDGDLDIFLSGQATNGLLTKIYRNNGGGGFFDSKIELPALMDTAAAWGDFDNDQDLDLVLIGYTEDSEPVTKLLRNNSRVPNAIPSVPSGLSASVNGTGVRLQWAPSSDPNQTGGISYNVRVGSIPGGSDVLSAMADPATGKLQLASMGNAQMRAFHVLTNLPAGTYYWSVQAIDHGFLSSAFAGEGTFSVTNSAPVADPLLIVMAEDTTAAITLTGSDPDSQAVSFTVTTQPTNGVLSGIPPNLSYQPKTNFFGADSFRFTATDGAESSIPATVSLVVTQRWDVLESKLGIRYSPFQGPKLSLTCEPYERYRIEVSSNLVHWVTLMNVVSTNGFVEFLLTDASQNEKRFFRAKLSPAQATLEPQIEGDNVFSLVVTGEPARSYRVEASSDMVDWANLGEFLMTMSPSRYTDPEPMRGSRRFYRVMALP